MVLIDLGFGFNPVALPKQTDLVSGLRFGHLTDPKIKNRIFGMNTAFAQFIDILGTFGDDTDGLNHP